MKTFVGICFIFLLPFFGFSQVVDTAKIKIEVDSLVKLAQASSKNRQFDEAIQVVTQAETLTVNTLGRNSKWYAKCLNVHGGIFYFWGKYDDAEKLFLEALEIYEKSVGKQNLDYGLCLSNLATLYYLKGDFAKSEPMLLESLSIIEKTSGVVSADYALSLTNLGNLYVEKGDYDAAEPVYLQSLSIREKTVGKNHPDYATSLNNLGTLYDKKGYTEKAENLYLEALKLREKLLGKNHPRYATTLNNLGKFYENSGDFIKAELYLQEAKTILENSLGKEHPNSIRVIINLANMYVAMGDYERAEPLFIQAKETRLKTLGDAHPDYAKALENLAILHVYKGNFTDAESLFLEIKSIREKKYEKNQPEYAIGLINFGCFYKDIEKYGKAEALLAEAKDILEKTNMTHDMDYVKIIENLANVYNAMGKYSDAESLYLQSKAAIKKYLGPLHPEFAIVLFNLSNNYWDNGDFSKASASFVEGQNALNLIFRKSIVSSTEAEIQNFQKLPLLKQFTPAFFSFTQTHPSDKLCSLAYDNALSFNKASLDAIISRMNGIRFSLDEGIKSLYSNYYSSQYQLSKWYEIPNSVRDSAIVAQLEEKARSTEKELIRRSPEFVEIQREVQWKDVQLSLQPHEAAIEFIHYRYYTPKLTDSIMYAALLIKPGESAPQFVPLFEEREIALKLAKASGSAFQNINNLYVQPVNSTNKGSALYELIWKPLEPALDGVSQVYCAPSGLLHKINLSAIQGQANRRVITVGSTRRLVLPDKAIQTNLDAYVLGGLRYESDSSAIANANSGITESRNSDNSSKMPFYADPTVRKGIWPYLTYSAAEVRAIGHTLESKGWNVTLETGFDGTEDQFKEIGKNGPSPRVLHISTHGYFYPDPKRLMNELSWFAPESKPAFQVSENPMIRSGLILAGGNDTWTGAHVPTDREDGILTAYEISQMNLSNTELVVLSACETGLGDIQGNEGVYGLQRAFKIAGAKYLIMSLWQVSDKRTQEFMDDFYKQWQVHGLSIPEAFRTAQDNMKKRFPEEPYFWAGFILVE